ncbi:hypothetical protein Smp_128510 [Schistosoma mansoni]|uniref:Uncharacterized protein n=1 Tax=Schistosoma mansoni TaxID=6183 RepID=G4VSC6_SCHMA|nr:hypothetical protein Smp_128510 [Schistosoma mansoni]|eukprot:XP_018654419.1 hypothetical protein Smp_128510 [Schistosoma mansoni]
MSNRNPTTTYESIGLTKKQYNLYRHLNSDNMKSILYQNDWNIPFHYIQCSRCHCKHFIQTNNTTNNLISSQLKEQQYEDYCHYKPILKIECPCNIIRLNTIKSNPSCCKVHSTTYSTNCCHRYYPKLLLVNPLCNYHDEQVNNHRCVHCLCQCCIQSKWTSSVIPSCSNWQYYEKSHE